MLGQTYTCPSEEIPDLESLDARIRADHIKDDAWHVFYRGALLSHAKLDSFSENSVTKLLISPGECTLTSHGLGYRIDMGRGIVVIISGILVCYPPGPYLFQHFGMLTDVIKVSLGKVECDFCKIDRCGSYFLPFPKFSLELRELLFNMQDKLSQVEYEDHEACNALTYLLVELVLKEKRLLAIEHMLDSLAQYKELAEKFRPSSRSFEPEEDCISI